MGASLLALAKSIYYKHFPVHPGYLQHTHAQPKLSSYRPLQKQSKTNQNKLLLDRRQFIFLRQCAFCGSKNGLCVRELFFGFCVLLRGIHAFHASMAFFAA